MICVCDKFDNKLTGLRLRAVRLTGGGKQLALIVLYVCLRGSAASASACLPVCLPIGRPVGCLELYIGYTVVFVILLARCSDPKRLAGWLNVRARRCEL